MPAVQIAQQLAFINWTVLTALSVGAFGAVAVLRRRSSATGGYLAFTTLCAVAFGFLAWSSDGALRAGTGDSPIQVDASWDAPRGGALLAFWMLALGSIVIRRWTPRGASIADAGAAIAAAVTLVAAAIAWGGGGLGFVPLLAQFVVVSAATGGVFAAMILGHWYLVTPKLPEAPLILLARVLLLVSAIQLVLFALWVGTGAGPAGISPFGALAGPWALFVWLRLIVGLIFPLIVSWAAVQTARSRSMESATGLLYINVGSVAAGTILAAGLYFGAGILV